MNKTATSPIRTTPRRCCLATAAGVAWATFLVAIAIHFACWRLLVPRPPVTLTVLTTGAAGAAAAATLLLGMWRAALGPRRRWSAGLAMLGLVPVVWWAAFIVDLSRRADARELIQWKTGTRVAAFWVSSIFDVAAGWAYPRSTHGRHVILMDDGSHYGEPIAKALVTKMDEHVERMATLLGQPVPESPMMWVRGSLFGQDSRCILVWAMCGRDGKEVELTSLDRHEMAHAVITALSGPDQEPPTLLAEGWAESQSHERDQLIHNLALMKKRDGVNSLDELIQPHWYSRSYGPVYSHGGPLVVYLIEHYGSAIFFELYHSSRHESFRDDCRRYLGDSWPEVEEQFWAWLAAQAETIASDAVEDALMESAQGPSLELAEGVDPALWQKIVDGYREATKQLPPWPESFAIAYESEWSRFQTDAANSNEDRKIIAQCVFDNDRCWIVERELPTGTTRSIVLNPEVAVDLERLVDGTVRHSPDVEESRQAVVEMAYLYRPQAGQDIADPARYLPLLPDPRPNDARITLIESIQPQALPEQPYWTIAFTQRSELQQGEYRYRLTLDPDADWRILRSQSAGPDEQESDCQLTLGTIHSRTVATVWEYRTKSDEFSLTRASKLRPMDNAEVAEVRVTAEAIAGGSPTPHTQPWHRHLTRPFVLGTIWTGVGIVLLGAGFFWRRKPNGIQGPQVAQS